MEQDVLIQRYVAESLTTPQIEEVERRMETDAVFKAEVEEYQLMAQGIKISEKKVLKTQLQNLEQKRVSKTSSFKNWGIAASIVALLGLGSFFVFQNINSTENLYASNFEIYPNTLQPVVRDVPGNAAFMAYEAGNYEKAITEFKTLLKTEKNPDIEFYLAMSYLNNGETDTALTSLASLETSSTRYLPQVHWYSALAHLKNDNTSLALQSLKALKVVDSSYKKEQRESLVNSLD